MSFKIAVASGKGGTGKTTVSMLICKLLDEFKGLLVDCDVEAPNDFTLLLNGSLEKEESVYRLVPSIHKENCSYCRKCAEYCEFNAIVVLPDYEFAEINTDLCHSCGACVEACQHRAISEYLEKIGTLSNYVGTGDLELFEGKLEIGSSMQSRMIRELKSHISGSWDYLLFDAPPGTDCSVVETIKDADYIVLVAEPTLFGRHDLDLMTELVKSLGLPFGVLINKSDGKERDYYDFLSGEGIDVLGKIPFDREYARDYATGNLPKTIPQSFQNGLVSVKADLRAKILQHEGDNYFKW